MASVFGESNDAPKSGLQASVLEKGFQQQTIHTGIPGFDDAVGDGLPGGNIYLITGSVGGSAIPFVQQILYQTAIQKGKVAYYAVENSSIDIIQDMKVYKMDIEPYVDDGSWLFTRVIPSNFKKIIDILPEFPMEHRLYLDQTFDGLMNHFHDQVKDGRNTAIHLQSLIRNFPMEEVQNLLLFLTGVVRRYGGIHFLLITEGAHDPSVLTTIKDTVDSVFDIVTTVRGNELENTVTIQKIRQMVPKSRVIRLSSRESGLATETVRRIQ